MARVLDSFPSTTTQQGYICRKVDADGECGYNAFGITREHALKLLTTRINDIQKIIQPAIKEVLVTDAFYDFLRIEKIIDENISLGYITEHIRSIC